MSDSERISHLISKRCASVSPTERSKSKEDSALDEVAIDELSVDSEERDVRFRCPAIKGEMDLRSSTAQYFSHRPNSTCILRFEHARKRLRRGNKGLIKERVAVKQDPLEPALRTKQNKTKLTTILFCFEIIRADIDLVLICIEYYQNAIKGLVSRETANNHWICKQHTCFKLPHFPAKT